MGTRGPVPKRSSERIRRNQDEGPVETITAIGVVEIPDLGFADPHPMIAAFYQSLRDSAQSRFYEPSDWQFARWTCHWMDGLIKSEKPSSMMLQTVNAALSDLLVTEGERRRVRLEVEREQETAKVLDVADMFRQRFSK